VAPNRLFDANAVVDVLLGEVGIGMDVSQAVLFDESILDLTIYEATNALWKLGVALDELTDDDLHAAVALVGSLPQDTCVETVSGTELTEVVETAQDEGLTVYDAAYLFTARREGVTLVTDDGGLHDAAATNGVSVATVADLGETDD
jgi:predicted nucleic acid-binding protein